MNRLLWTLVALPLLRGEPVDVRTSGLPWAIINTAYSAVLEAGVEGGCPQGDVNFSLQTGTLPKGIEIKGGSLVGTAKETGTFFFSVRAWNNCSSSAKDLELVVTGKPILRVFPEELTYEYRAGEANPAPLTVQVSSTWADLPYLVQSGAEWLIRKGGGITAAANSGLASDLVSLEIRATSLAPGTYRTSVQFSAWSGANAPSVTVTLKVLAADTTPGHPAHTAE